jgi:hypothetical protein
MNIRNFLLSHVILVSTSFAAEPGGVNFVDGQAPLIVTLRRVPEQRGIWTKPPAKSDATITKLGG